MSLFAGCGPGVGARDWRGCGPAQHPHRSDRVVQQLGERDLGPTQQLSVSAELAADDSDVLERRTEGPADRGPDGRLHCRVQAAQAPTEHDDLRVEQVDQAREAHPDPLADPTHPCERPAVAGRDPGISDIDDVLADVASGNRRALAGVRRIGEWVGVGLASLINLFNPEVVVLGGSLGSLYPAMESSVRSAVGRALGPTLENVAIVRSELGADAQLLGGAEVAFAELLHDPVGTMRVLGGSAPAPVASPDARAASSE